MNLLHPLALIAQRIWAVVERWKGKEALSSKQARGTLLRLKVRKRTFIDHIARPERAQTLDTDKFLH